LTLQEALHLKNSDANNKVQFNKKVKRVLTAEALRLERNF